jgi:HD-GYP domain-containing protein (c-di-GMP phosphodiesterase class II)
MEGALALLFVIAAVAMAILLPSERASDPVLFAGLVVGYAVVERVRFEFGGLYGTAEQLMIMPMLLLSPLPYAAFLIAGANLLAIVPEIARGRWHRERFTSRLADCWFCIPPILLLAALAPGEPKLEHVDVYALAFAAQLAGNFATTLVRNRLFDRVPIIELWSGWIGISRVDAIFAPLAIFITLPATRSPFTLLAVGPLVWLLKSFARDREDRYAKALELNRAYRGTVMLLSDVVEFDDEYTGSHSRSVVGLVNATADRLGVDDNARQELEFAAMLHDVGKIAIPKDILNKPSALTESEFEVMKTHTIEGQFMLDRVGGLLGRVGEIVRSCHERWDGKGYPDGLKAEEIPLASRIVFTCDAYSAMTSDRVYRSAMSREAAVEELFANAGTQFDPRVVAALAEVIEDGEPVGVAADEVRVMLATAPVQRNVRASITS